MSNEEKFDESEDVSPPTDEDLKTVIEAMHRVLKEQGFDYAGEVSPEEHEAVVREHEESISGDAAAARSEVNYDKEMALDAKAIAEKLAIETGLPVKVVMKVKGDPKDHVSESDVPKPTLESLRENAKKVAETFGPCVTKLLVHRKKAREQGASRAMITYLRTGKGDALRDFVQTDKHVGPVYAQLEDHELVELVSVNLQDNTTVAGGLGIWTGLMLARAGFKDEEILDCACDPIFVTHALALKMRGSALTKQALEVFAEVAKADHERRQKASH